MIVNITNGEWKSRPVMRDDAGMAENRNGPARRLRQLRASLRLSQAEFGRRAGILQQHAISQFELGPERPNGRRLSLDAATKIAATYNVTLDWLLEGKRGTMPMDRLQQIEDAAPPEDE